MFEGSSDAKILFVSDFPRSKELEAKQVLSGERRDILVNALSSAGILASDYAMMSIHDDSPKGNKASGFSQDSRVASQLKAKAIINESKANVIVPLGDYALKFLTGKESASKYHLSQLPSKAEFGARKAIPLLHPESVQRSYSDVAYIRFGCVRLKEEMSNTLLTIPERKFRLSLDMGFQEIEASLEEIIRNAREVSTDVETGNGFVNTVGLSVSPYEALVIESGHSRWKPNEFHKLWSLFKRIWESESIGKIAQNGLFEKQWASIYGIRFKNLSFDTMIAMKFLHPTLERGLDNVGRIYTRYPYWKDDHSDWNNIRDWRSHLTYCGKDTTGQFAAKVEMEKALEARGMLVPFQSFIMPQLPIANEMMVRGLRLDSDMVITLKEKGERDVLAMTESLDVYCEKVVGKKVNTNSPKQLKEAFRALGMKIPTAKGKETVSKAALLKLKNKYPKELMIGSLLKIAQLKKNTEEYLNFEPDSDGRVRFSFDLASDENGSWVGKKTIFDRGFDPTGIPNIVKNCIVADEGMIFVQLKLLQPELHFIAKDAPDYKLQGMLTAHKDVNRYFAAKLFRKNEEMVSRNEIKVAQQVIKSANELDAPRMFIEKCFSRAQVFYSETEAKRMMQMWMEEFMGCRRRIDRIRKQLYSSRTLSGNGRSITYYDRINDSLLRRALSWGVEADSSDRVSRLAIQLEPKAEMVCRNNNSLLVQIKDSEWAGFMGELDMTGIEVKTGARWGTLDNV